MRLPEFWLRHTFYFEGHLFKSNFLAQIGFDIRYNSPYYAGAYMPATGNFYLQNQKSLFNYPMIDLFISAQISKARIFFKVNFVNQGLFEKGYFSSPYYPMPDRSFRGGISWRFYD